MNMIYYHFKLEYIKFQPNNVDILWDKSKKKNVLNKLLGVLIVYVLFIVFLVSIVKVKKSNVQCFIKYKYKN